jgi:hypothetical protein
MAEALSSTSASSGEDSSWGFVDLIRGKFYCRIAGLVASIVPRLYGSPLCASPATGQLSGIAGGSPGKRRAARSRDRWEARELIAERSSDFQGKSRFAGVASGIYHVRAESPSLNAIGVEVVIGRARNASHARI